MENNFVHLHVHTHYSFLDGYGSPLSRVQRAKELGMTTIAITDHNSLSGAPDYIKACQQENVKPMLGIELYYTEDTRIMAMDIDNRKRLALYNALDNREEISNTAKPTKKDKEIIDKYMYNMKRFHILFLAKNQKGWHNLVKLQSEASEKCQYMKDYICDDDMMYKYREGLIMTTACIGGIIAQYVLSGQLDKAEQKLNRWHYLFKDDFYLEIQPYSELEQLKVNLFLINYAKKHNVKLVATNDVHYTLKDDWDDHDTLLCIGTGKFKSEKNRMFYAHEFWLRSYDEMIEAFEYQYNKNRQVLNNIMPLEDYIAYAKEALKNTNEVEAKVENNIEIGSKITLLPKAESVNGLNSAKQLSLMSYQNLYKYLSKHPELNVKEYINRLAHELYVINTKGYADYMLIVKDNIDWCQEHGIPVGPGRGSAAGSLVLFVNGITKAIDPVKYGLLFFRFLTINRTSLPDVDCDFSYLHRDELIKHMQDKYGKDNVCSIGTYTLLKVKNGIKDVGRVLGYPLSVTDTLSKKVNTWLDEADISFEKLDALKDSSLESERNAYKDYLAAQKKYPDIFRLARKFEGTPRNQSIHASGVLVMPMKISEMFPTRYDKKSGRTVTLYTGPECEELGSCKLDILGLKTLDVLDIAIKSVDKKLTVYDLYDIVEKHTKDKKMFEMLNEGNSEGIFQFESNMFKGLIDDMCPSSINSLIAMTALGRPGPMSAGLNKNYARRIRGEEELVAPLKDTWDVVEDTYGVMCYQEDAMRISQIVAGFNDNQADSYLRKSIAKKKKKLMDLCDQWFVYGKKNTKAPKDYDEDNKEQVFYDPEGKYGDEIIGGINNGYTKKELKAYLKMISGFSSYLFNKSHAATYSFISLCTMYLATYYTPQFFAGLLSMQEKQKNIELYIATAKTRGIDTCVPEINESGDGFKYCNGRILYGIGAIKGIGAKAVPYLLKYQPYSSVEDAYERCVNDKGRKVFNKKIGEALIKAGAFDCFDSNRNKLLNDFIKIRKKKETPYNESDYTKQTAVQYELELLGHAFSDKTEWQKLEENQEMTADMIFTSIREHIDKSGNLMAFAEGILNGEKITGVIFSKTYVPYKDMLKIKDKTRVAKVRLVKSKNNQFILKTVISVEDDNEDEEEE